MRLTWYYTTVWPIYGWEYRTMHVWSPPRDVPGVGRVYGVLAYDAPLTNRRELEDYGLIPVEGVGHLATEAEEELGEARKEIGVLVGV
jgi:hypothetical protein